MSIGNIINYMLLYLVHSTGCEVGNVIKAPHLNLVTMQTDDLREFERYMNSELPSAAS